MEILKTALHGWLTAICFVLICMVGTDAVGQESPDPYLVKELKTSSSSGGVVLKSGFLFISDMDHNYKHRVYVYDAASLQLVHSIPIAHSITGLYPYQNGLIALGRRVNPEWSSHMTVIGIEDGSFRVSSRMLSKKTMPESIVALQSTLYLNEKGSSSIYRMTSAASPMRNMGVRISGPSSNMRIHDGFLYVVELRDLYAYGDESIARIQLNTGEKSFVAQHEIFYGLREVEVLDGFVLGIEEDTHTIAAINLESNQLVGRVPVARGPRSITTYGSCAVVTSSADKSLTFVRVFGDHLEVVHRMSLARAGDRLKLPSKSVIDQPNGRIYVRSDYPCASCSVTQSSVFGFETDEAALAEACL